MNKIKLLITTIIVLLSLFFVYFTTYYFVESKAYDFMTKHVVTEKLPFDKNKQTYGSDDVVIVVIDDQTIEKYRWPWKRELYCPIFEYFYQYAKPKALVFDFIFATLDYDNIQSDYKLFNLLKKFDNLIVAFAPKMSDWQDEKRGKVYEKRFTEKFGIKNIKDEVFPKPELVSSVIPFPLPYFDIIKYTGSVSLLPSFINGNIENSDEIIRNQEYLIRYNNTIVPSLSMATFLYLNDNPQIVVTNSKIIFPDLNITIPQVTRTYQSTTPIRYYKPYAINGYTHTYYSARSIMSSYENIKKGLKPEIDPEIFKDKIVVIGGNVPAAPNLDDVLNTPIYNHHDHAGVDIQATMIDNIVHQDFLKVAPQFVNIFLALLGMVVIYGIIRIYDLFKSITYSFLLVILYLALCCTCYYFKIIINVITPVVMFVVTMILGYIHKFVLENRSKEKVKNAMGKYMSQDVMQRVMMNIDNLGLGGKKANVTVLFSDIRGFTSMSENMSAQEVSEILNEYFTEMEPIVTKHNGIINKFIGDAVMAIFGEPIQDKNHAINAVKCGYEMLLKVKELQSKWSNEGKPKIEIGIGINTGEVFVGNIGSINRMEYTVIGDTVNLASRLESYNKIYKTKMLISSSTYEETKGIVDTIKISDVEIRGKSQKMNIYEVLKVM